MGTAVFAFGVTYSKNHDLAMVAHQTWAGRFPGFVWFSTAPEPRLKGKMVVLRHCHEPVYNNMTWRMIDIWAHVWRYWFGYDYYMRLWDDNWVDHITLRAMIESSGLLKQGAAAMKQHWGRVAMYGDIPFVGGGAGSLLSQGGASAWLGDPFKQEGLLALADWCREAFKADVVTYAEDVWLCHSMNRAGVEQIGHPGFQAFSVSLPKEPSWERLTADDLACRRPFQELDDAVPSPIVTMHYVDATDMVKLTNITDAGCSETSS